MNKSHKSCKSNSLKQAAHGMPFVETYIFLNIDRSEHISSLG